MEKKILKKKLLIDLGKNLAVFGFKNRISRQSFKRESEGGEVSVHLAFINHTEDFDVTMDFGVRFDEVEKLKHIGNNMLTEKEKKETYTFGVELGNLSIGQQRRWSVYSEDDLPFIIKSMTSEYEEFGEPYFQKHSSLEKAYELLSEINKVGQRPDDHSGYKSMSLIVIAKLLNKPDINKLIEEQKIFLGGIRKDVREFYLNKYLDFIKSWERNIAHDT